MSESNTWKDGFILAAGLDTANQVDLSGLSNSQRSNRMQSPSMRHPGVNNGPYNHSEDLDSSNNHDNQTQQSSHRFSSPFDLNFDDSIGGFSEYMSKQMGSQANTGSAAIRGSKSGFADFNQQSVQVPSQPLQVSSQSNVFSSWQDMDQYPSLGGNDSSTLLTKDTNSNQSEQTTNKIISNRFLLGSKVQPFTRDEETEDDDLFKVFDDELGALATKKLQMHKAVSASGILPDYPPASNASTMQQQSEMNQGNMIASEQCAYNSNLSARDFATLRQQEQQEEARMQKLCRVGKPSIEASPPSSKNDETEDSFDSQFFVPSTMMPPTVLASTMSSYSNKRKPENDRSQRKKSRTCASGVSPQSKLDELFQKAGIFGVQRVKADEAEYEVVPSALQLASFGTRVVKAVHTSDEKALSELMECGLSPNPCNQFRDSILDLVCKRGNVAIFECLIKHGTDLQTMDGFGRTPLHHCCWASSFCRPIVDAILERDPMQLVIEDKRGQTPLEYVRADLASDWIQYLESNLHKYWGSTVPTLSSPKAKRPSGTLPDPPNAMPVNLASMVSSGKLLPAQVIPMIRSRKMKSS